MFVDYHVMKLLFNKRKDLSFNFPSIIFLIDKENMVFKKREISICWYKSRLLLNCFGKDLYAT